MNQRVQIQLNLKKKYFSGYSDTRSVQENFNLIASFIQESADKHVPSKSIRLVSSGAFLSFAWSN